MKVLVNYELSDRLKNRIKKAVECVDLVFTTDPEESLKEIRDSDALFGYLTSEMLEVAQKLKWNQTPMAGLARYLPKLPELIESEIIVTNAAGIYDEEIATHVFALITAFSRDLPTLIRSQDDGVWVDRKNLRIEPLLGKTLGVIGLGGIGTEVAKRGNAFGMRVIATRAHPEKGKPSFVEKMWGIEGLNQLLEESDFTVICTPHTPTTEKMIRRKELKTMKKSSFLINIGRGVSIDLKDLAFSLLSGEISGAGLDVFEEEPLPKDSPLWKMKNVIITPHVAAAGLSSLYEERRVQIFLNNLKNFIEGKDLTNIVDKRTWH
ncbi:MAG: D-2-hydroxyacid dehydrogenase [Promethearchaeota archaeon]|jgi:phosphoglycerate dehydrogenase-like enzyme